MYTTSPNGCSCMFTTSNLDHNNRNYIFPNNRTTPLTLPQIPI